MDMNDRALRDVVTSLGGVANGFPRQTGFDITVASEVMAIFCLATGPEEQAAGRDRLAPEVVPGDEHLQPRAAGGQRTDGSGRP